MNQNDAVALFKDAYLKFWSLAPTITPPCAWLPYDKFKGADVGVLMYDFIEGEYTRELLNTINQYATNMHKLAIWQQVFDDYSEDQRFELGYEFTKMLAYYVLHQPYEFKSRLIYCAVHLCYQVGLSTGTLNKADLVDDFHVDKDELKKVASGTPAGKHLIHAIGMVNDKSHTKATRNFRNRTQHGLPPTLSHGIRARVDRSTASDGSLVFAFGIEDALEIGKLMPALVTQSKRMIAAFNAYWALVQSHAMASKASGAH